jgi:murein DD-endopeptidase MepM/ murein hydrolase activator NlpD
MDSRLMRLGGQSQKLRQSAEEVLETVRQDVKSMGRIPSILPLAGGRLTSRFGRRIDPFTGRPASHEGLDLSARRGTPIVATADGRVSQVEYSGSGYGNMVSLEHGNGFQTRFAHCDRILVEPGQEVTRGETIATVGNSGHSTAPHVHYEILKDGTPYNPSQYILSGEFIVD